MGTLFYEFAAREKKKFLIESHSDYIVDNYRLNYLDSRIKKKPQAQILFFSRIADGKNSVIPIGISDEGKLLNVPPNYRDFFLKQKLRQLEL